MRAVPKVTIMRCINLLLLKYLLTHIGEFEYFFLVMFKHATLGTQEVLLFDLQIRNLCSLLKCLRYVHFNNRLSFSYACFVCCYIHSFFLTPSFIYTVSV